MSKREAHYHEFETLPTYSAPVWGPKPANGGDRKLLNETDPYKWSGSGAPPPIGAKVKVYMNQLGTGIVVGYFAEYGWLGALVKPTKPPKWWREQNPGSAIYHVFGLDLEPRVQPTKAAE